MDNALHMTDPFEARKNTQAAMITAAFAGAMLLLMFLLKWPLPTLPVPPHEEGILVDLNIPDEPAGKVLGGGGGGGNPVQASGEKGTAYSPPQQGTPQEVKDVETDDKDLSTAPVIKPDHPKPTATKINDNTAVTKAKPKEVIATPAPPRPKAVLGRTLGGTGTGGGVAENYDRSGGSGTGQGVGNGSGTGGGSGSGSGGGNGSGSGTGSGPRRISGNRVVINPKSMDAGENLRGKVLAEIRVSPDGVGTFLRATRGSTYTSGQAIDIIREWLRRNRFNKADEESTVVYEFNFLLGG
ncbi:MAG TPA: hypothetical protein VG870_11755 [Chitinophagaceae bacterium]|nr:hypothetical protein [Chitinophagaceae bacterium]